jgi:hypothetical protein
MSSETVVFQSFRTHNVPAWIGRCMESARAWARLRGFEYRFIDDRFFEYVPAQFRAKIDDKVLWSDLARLLVARELLASEFERVVWIDADVVVFDPAAWVLPEESPFYFCHELWPTPMEGGVRFDIRANNAVMVFSRGNSFLEFYIDSCERILRSSEPLKSWHLGVRFLTGVRDVSPLPLLNNIGMFGADMLRDLVAGPGLLTKAYMKAMGVPLVAANCCGSVAGTTAGNVVLDEKVFERVVGECLESKGEAVNRYLRV